jgi:hypothetical protein
MRIFLPSLKEVASLMQRQLDAAEAKGISIQVAAQSLLFCK